MAADDPRTIKLFLLAENAKKETNLFATHVTEEQLEFLDDAIQSYRNINDSIMAPREEVRPNLFVPPTSFISLFTHYSRLPHCKNDQIDFNSWREQRFQEIHHWFAVYILGLGERRIEKFFATQKKYDSKTHLVRLYFLNRKSVAERVEIRCFSDSD